MKKKTLNLLAVLGVTGGLVAGTLTSATAALAASGETHELKEQEWSFEGYMGHYDREAVRRGFEVYKNVCSACHSLQLVAFRNLSEPGGPELSEAQMKAIAAEYEVPGFDDQGEAIMRPAGPADHFPPLYNNADQAAAMNGGAVPPDLSLMAKARHDGPNYIYSLLTGYEEEMPEDFHLTDGLNYNPYFPGGQLAMAQPLWGDDVEFADGTEATIEQEAHDLVQFLMWTAEPKLEERKTGGRKALIFLLILTGLTFVCYRMVWSDVDH